MPASLALVALAVLFGLIRPALKAALPAPAQQLKGRSSTPWSTTRPRCRRRRIRRRRRRACEQQLDGARGLAKDNPAAVANIVRSWVTRK